MKSQKEMRRRTLETEGKVTLSQSSKNKTTTNSTKLCPSNLWEAEPGDEWAIWQNSLSKMSRMLPGFFWLFRVKCRVVGEGERKRMELIIQREIECKYLENSQPDRRIKSKVLGRKHQGCGWATFSDIIMEAGAIHQDNGRVPLRAFCRLLWPSQSSKFPNVRALKTDQFQMRGPEYPKDSSVYHSGPPGVAAPCFQVLFSLVTPASPHTWLDASLMSFWKAQAVDLSFMWYQFSTHTKHKNSIHGCLHHLDSKECSVESLGSLRLQICSAICM